MRETGVPVFAFPSEARQHWASRAHEKGQSKSGLIRVVVEGRTKLPTSGRGTCRLGGLLVCHPAHGLFIVLTDPTIGLR